MFDQTIPSFKWLNFTNTCTYACTHVHVYIVTYTYGRSYIHVHVYVIVEANIGHLAYL